MRVGIDYESTVRMIRAQKSVTARHGVKALTRPGEKDEPGYDDICDRHVVPAGKRAVARTLWSGAIKSAVRMKGINLRKSALCPHCLEEDETEEILDE